MIHGRRETLLGYHFFKLEQQHESRDGRQNGAYSFRLETNFESLHFFSGKDDLSVFIQLFLQAFDYTTVTD